MKKLMGKFAWAIILLAALWLALIAIPQFCDRISRHEDAWAREFGDMANPKVSDGD